VGLLFRMPKRDAIWAIRQYESVRSLLPTAHMPAQSSHAENLGAISEHFDVFLLDAFGVLNVGETGINGAVKRVELLKSTGKTVLVLTNGARLPAESALKKFLDLGFHFDLSDIVSSRDALAAALPPLPNDGFWGIMSSQNSQIETLGVPCHRLEDEKSTYDKASGFILLSSSEWNNARQLLLRESLAKAPRPILVGNPDIIAPRESQLSLEPGHYAYELGRDLKLDLKLFGKPFANIYDLAFKRLPNIDRSRVAMVGDSLHTDVLGGAAYGVKTVLVTEHGLFSGFDCKRFVMETKIVPDFIIPTI